MSTPKKDQTPTKGKTPPITGRDIEVVAKAFACFKEQPQIDFAKLATLAGYKNQRSAQVCWGNTRAKLMAFDPADIAAAVGSPGNRVNNKRKTPTSSAPAVGGGRSVPATPAPATRYSGNFPAYNDEDDDDDDFPVPTPSKKQRGPKGAAVIPALTPGFAPAFGPYARTHASAGAGAGAGPAVAPTFGARGGSAAALGGSGYADVDGKGKGKVKAKAEDETYAMQEKKKVKKYEENEE